MLQIPLSATTYKIPILLIATSDHISGLTGATVTGYVSKNGGAAAACAGTFAEVSSGNMPGTYTYTPTSSETGTLGALNFHFTAASADPVDIGVEVVAFNPFDAAALGLSSVATTLTDVVALGTSVGTIGTEVAALPSASANATAVWAAGARTITGTVNLNLAQALDLTQIGTADTVGQALNGALAAITKAVIAGTPGSAGATLTVYAADGTTVLKAFNLATAGSRV